MKHMLTALTLFAVLASPAWSFMAYGQGVLTCAELTEYHDRFGESLGAKQWIYGYVTARNFENYSDKGEGKHKAFYAAIIQDCRQNPLDDSLDATNRLYNKLR